MSEIRDAWGSTAAEREAERGYVRAPFLPSFDREFYESFGRWPSGSPLAGTAPGNSARSSARRAKIQALATRSPFAGERETAQRMLDNMDAEADHHRSTMDRLDAEAYDTGEAEL